MAKYESIADLVNVTFQDATNHVSFNTDDIMGLVMPYYWGVSDTMGVYNKTSFYEVFPESLPIGVTSLSVADKEVFSGYAQVKSFFAHGGGMVEVYRPLCGFGYQRMTIKSGNVSTLEIAADGKQHDESADVSIALKYAGFVPQSLATGFSNLKIKVAPIAAGGIEGYDGTDTCVRITVLGVRTGEDDVKLEEFEGSSNPNANISGESIFLENVVKSDFIDVRVFSGMSSFTASEQSLVSYSSVALATVADKVEEAYKYFRDYEKSSATLLINPFVTQTGNDDYEDINDDIAQAAERRKNCLAVIGYPIEKAFDKAAIKTYYRGLNAYGDKFAVAMSGREIISLFGYRFTLNCVGGYCGRLIGTARDQHVNQVASGYTYGLYGGSLKESLLSGEVIELMEDDGINSIYVSARGNTIFGTRTMYSKQTSYFGKLNVMRVCAAILKNIFPIAIETLHTDAASNPITRASLSTMLNSIIGTFIDSQDLFDDSEADCSDSINTDYLTKGGTVLNIILTLHFIGLVEKVNIKVIATDTSVSAEFV